MRNGDISNEEAGRLWFVAEGLVLLPLKHEQGVHMMPNARKIGTKRAIASYLRNSYEINTWTYKRMWDLSWRLDFRLAIVTFNVTADYADVMQEWLDEFDMPAPVRAYSHERFMDAIVTLPSCLRVFDPDPSRALGYGSKGVWVDPSLDFEPLV